LAIFETKIQMQRIGKIFLATMVCLAVGFLSSFATQSYVKDWYPTLVKPFFNPPSWVFAPVWALLYIMMGIAAGLVWSKAMSIKAKIPAIGFFILQLGLNALWSILFFGFKNPLLALVEIILLWICIPIFLSNSTGSRKATIAILSLGKLCIDFEFFYLVA
jgi:tryptophan-rich sensory protein